MNPITGNAKDFWTGVIYCVVGGAVLLISRDYEMGTALKMGPAYFPTILSGLLILIGAISVIRSFVKKGTPIGAFAIKGLFLVVGATVLFGAIVRGAGIGDRAAPAGSGQCSCQQALPLAIHGGIGGGGDGLLHPGLSRRPGGAAADPGGLV